MIYYKALILVYSNAVGNAMVILYCLSMGWLYVGMGVSTVC